jgi:hypothetical protein
LVFSEVLLFVNESIAGRRRNNVTETTHKKHVVGRMDWQHNVEEDDDIRTVNTVNFFNSNSDRVSVSGSCMSTGMTTQASPDNCNTNLRNQINANDALTLYLQQQQQPPFTQLYPQIPSHPTQACFPTAAQNEFEVQHSRNNDDDESDNQTANTMEYPPSLNSLYSHRDALSANGSYGADMSFVTLQTSSVASPTHPKSLPSLRLHQVTDSNDNEETHNTVVSEPITPPAFQNRAAITQSVIKAAVDRGTYMAYDASSSVFGLSTVANTITSSANMTHNYSNDANPENGEDADHLPACTLPHPLSLPHKNTDQTADSMFLGMEYDNDYIQTAVNPDLTSAAAAAAAMHSKQSHELEIDKIIRDVHRRRVICCVYTLIVLILLVGVGGITCFFGTTCPGVTKVRGSTASSINENKNTPTPTRSPVFRKVPSTTTTTSSPSTLRPAAVVTDIPTLQPIVDLISPTVTPFTQIPVAKSKVNDSNGTNDKPSSNDNSKNDVPTAAPTRRPNKVDDSNDTGAPTRQPNKDDSNDRDVTPKPTRRPIKAISFAPSMEPTPSFNNDDRFNNQNNGRFDDDTETVVPTFFPTNTDDRNNDDRVRNRIQ